MLAPVKGSNKKSSAVHIRTLFDLNSFLKTPVKGMKIVDVGCSDYKPYCTILATSREVYFLEVKRNSVPSGCVLNKRMLGDNVSIECLVSKNKRLNNVELELDIENNAVVATKLNLKGTQDQTYPADTKIKVSP